MGRVNAGQDLLIDDHDVQIRQFVIEGGEDSIRQFVRQRIEIAHVDSRQFLLSHIGFADKVDFDSHGVDNQEYMFTTAA